MQNIFLGFEKSQPNYEAKLNQKFHADSESYKTSIKLRRDGSVARKNIYSARTHRGFHVIIHSEVRRLTVNGVKRRKLFVHLVQAFLGVDSEAEDIIARSLCRLNDQRQSVFRFPYAKVLHLHKGERYVEALVRVGKPDQSNVGDDEAAQISLIA